MNAFLRMVLGAACLLVVACSPDSSSDDLWDGDPAALSGAWRATQTTEQGRPYLLMDLSGVYRVVLETETQATEIDRGTYMVESGVLVRITTRHIDPSLVGQRNENGIYRVTSAELLLEPSAPGGLQDFYQRTTHIPEFNPLH